MKAIINHLEFEFKSVLRDKTLLLMNYLFPLVFYFMMVLIMPGINRDFSKSMIPGMIVFTIMVSTLLGMPSPIAFSKEKGIYRSYKIYGVPLRAVLLVPVITTAVHITIVSIIILITGTNFFGSIFPHNFLNFCLIYFVSLFAFSGLGTLIGVCSPNSKVTVLLAQLIFIPSMMLGGIMMPTEILSQNVQKLSRILPSTHCMNALGTISFDRTSNYSISGSITILLLGGLLAFILSAYLFTWDSKCGKLRKNILGLAALLPYFVSVFIL
ncbi:ABC transporter permease [Clostridium sp. CF012]|uniref:ABC transporter permease n=1 Tax=Clostridium sp. CF012 TaxID=2843319 RepID=UPI001C0DE715|nr:ABC transporter permease [Clostridium sp. CF012]MBU3144028.1 ABC transporter permease [Clostridium sp. CF012]